MDPLTFNIDIETANLQGHFTCVLISCAGHGHVLGFYNYLQFLHPYFDLHIYTCVHWKQRHYRRRSEEHFRDLFPLSEL